MQRGSIQKGLTMPTEGGGGLMREQNDEGEWRWSDSVVGRKVNGVKMSRRRGLRGNPMRCQYKCHSNEIMTARLLIVISFTSPIFRSLGEYTEWLLKLSWFPPFPHGMVTWDNEILAVAFHRSSKLRIMFQLPRSRSARPHANKHELVLIKCYLLYDATNYAVDKTNEQLIRIKPFQCHRDIMALMLAQTFCKMPFYKVISRKCPAFVH